MNQSDDVELMLDAKAELGEGPFWHPEESALYWVDVLAGRVNILETGRVYDVGQPVGAAVPRASGGLVLAMRDGFAILDTSNGKVELMKEVEAGNPANRMNDGKCDSAGRLFAGTMAFKATPKAGALYCLRPDWTLETVAPEVGISNGLAWSADGTRMYYIDSLAFGIDVFDFDPATGTTSNRRRLVDVSVEEGFADGMCIDSEGALWVALYGGSCVRRYSPDGELDRVVQLPVTQPTSCCFGGEGLADLYITTARQGVTDQPLAGGLFRHRPGVAGVPANSFAG